MLKIAICDDDSIILNNITTYITETHSNSEIYSFTSAETLINSEIIYDIYFLDIQMPDMDGIQAARQIRKKHPQCIIVFITGTTSYMQDAFDVHAFYYLLKPFSKERFLEVFEEILMEYHRSHRTQFVLVKVGAVSQKIMLQDIYYIDCFRKKVTLHTKSGPISFYSQMELLSQQLNDSFFRCHRSIIINFEYVSEYELHSVTLTNGENLPMAKQKYSDFVKAFMFYARNGGAINV